MALRFFNLCNMKVIYVLYYVYIFVHAAKIKWTFVLSIACVDSRVQGKIPWFIEKFFIGIHQKWGTYYHLLTSIFWVTIWEQTPSQNFFIWSKFKKKQKNNLLPHLISQYLNLTTFTTTSKPLTTNITMNWNPQTNKSLLCLRNLIINMTRKSKNSYSPGQSKSHSFHPNRVETSRMKWLISPLNIHILDITLI